MTRPDSCPNCGASVTSHTGSYCHECGERLVGDVRAIGWSSDLVGPFTVKRVAKELPIIPENYEAVHNGTTDDYDDADAYVDRNESPDNSYKYVILDGEGRRIR